MTQTQELKICKNCILTSKTIFHNRSFSFDHGFYLCYKSSSLKAHQTDFPMNIIETLKAKNFPDEAIKTIASNKFTDFHPPQEEAIKKGVLDGKNILLSVPTASGKTFIAELAMVKSILLDQGRCLYIAPLKALASEKYNDFKNKYESMGLKVGLAIGDEDTQTSQLNQYHILIATAEKVDSLMRFRAKWLVDSLTVVVLDEIHFINDGKRGPTLEILTARIRLLNPKIQIIALSATVSNAREMAGWLNAELVLSNFRPIPLKEGVYYNDRIVFQEYGVKMISEDDPNDVNKLTMDTVRGKGQVLIFVNSRRSAQAVSREVSSAVSKLLTPDERKKLKSIADKIGGSKSDSTKVCRKLADVVVHGAAFHHAGLKPFQRELIEANFKINLIKAISCTPTLAAGVNLPARRAIIRDFKRFESGIGSSYIPTSEYKQCAGRAGRPQYDEYGEAVLIAKSASESAALFEKYIRGDTEPVISKLSDESSLRIHILAAIASGYVSDENGMFDFLSHTFLFYQRKSMNLLYVVKDIFGFLSKEKFIEKSGSRFFSTPLGNLTSRLYIDPLTTITIRDGLLRIHGDQFSVNGLLHMIACCPDNPRLNVTKTESEELEKFESLTKDELILNTHNWPYLDDYFAYMSTMKMTFLLSEWIDEKSEEAICDQFSMGPGDIYRHIESTQWLLYAAATIADLLMKKNVTIKINDIKQRIHYGIKEELLKIVQLKGVGRIRARQLFNHGYKKLIDFRFTSADKLSDVPQIGKSLAQDILKQIHIQQRATIEKGLPVLSE